MPSRTTKDGSSSTITTKPSSFSSMMMSRSHKRWTLRSVRLHHLFTAMWIMSLGYQLFTLLNSSSTENFPSSSSSVQNYNLPTLAQLSSVHTSNNTFDSSFIIKDHFSEQDKIRSEHYFFVMAQSTSTQCSESVTNNTVYCCPPPYQKEARKSKLTAFLLSFFLGVLGVDRFYLGFYLMGVIKLLTIGGCGGKFVHFEFKVFFSSKYVFLFNELYANGE